MSSRWREQLCPAEPQRKEAMLSSALSSTMMAVVMLL